MRSPGYDIETGLQGDNEPVVQQSVQIFIRRGAEKTGRLCDHKITRKKITIGNFAPI